MGDARNQSFEPLRILLKDTKWLGGDRPNYADYCILAVFLWTASVAKFRPCTTTIR